MKIAITGHSAGIGLALAKQYEQRGHEIVGLSKRYGDDIRDIQSILPKILECDWFINNAQEGFAQTELLYAVYDKWKGVKGKRIITIGTSLSVNAFCIIPGSEADLYRTQKVALDEAYKQMFSKYDWPKMVMVRPGAVNTALCPNPEMAADPDEWAEKAVHILEDVGPNLEVYEIVLGTPAQNNKI